MTTLSNLVKRNLRIYYRSKGNVFSSLLACIIVIVLMVVFLGDMNIDSITNILKEYGGIRDAAVDEANALSLILNWITAGIVIVNSVTITLTVIGTMIDDEENHKLISFYVSPLKRSTFVLSYVISGFIMGTIMCILTVLLAEGYIYLSGSDVVTFKECLTAIGYALVVEFFSSGVTFFLTSLIHTKSAFSGLGTISGTLIGFLAGIYLPIGTLPEGVATVCKYIPFMTASALVRSAFTGSLIEKTFTNVPDEVISEYKSAMGITLEYGSHTLTATEMMLLLLGCGIIFTVISIIIQSKHHAHDR